MLWEELMGDHEKSKPLGLGADAELTLGPVRLRRNENGELLVSVMPFGTTRWDSACRLLNGAEVRQLIQFLEGEDLTPAAIPQGAQLRYYAVYPACADLDGDTLVEAMPKLKAALAAQQRGEWKNLRFEASDSCVELIGERYETAQERAAREAAEAKAKADRVAHERAEYERLEKIYGRG